MSKQPALRVRGSHVEAREARDYEEASGKEIDPHPGMGRAR
jgi:hypothetical protein